MFFNLKSDVSPPELGHCKIQIWLTLYLLVSSADNICKLLKFRSQINRAVINIVESIKKNSCNIDIDNEISILFHFFTKA